MKDGKEDQEVTDMLSSTEVTYLLVQSHVVGKLTVCGDEPVIVKGPMFDRNRARAVLKREGFELTPYPEYDEWRSRS